MNQHQRIITAVPPWASGVAFVTEVCERCHEALNVEVEVTNEN